MSNTGKIQPIQETFSEFKFVQGKIYKRAILTSAVSKLILTIKTDEPNIIDIVHTFKPASRSMVDYFMKVSSSVKSDTLYHDANGFLVAKRPLNKRPDYQFEAKPEDIINEIPTLFVHSPISSIATKNSYSSLTELMEWLRLKKTCLLTLIGQPVTMAKEWGRPIRGKTKTLLDTSLP